jgi:hypothetical protein
VWRLVRVQSYCGGGVAALDAATAYIDNLLRRVRGINQLELGLSCGLQGNGCSVSHVESFHVVNGTRPRDRCGGRGV